MKSAISPLAPAALAIFISASVTPAAAQGISGAYAFAGTGSCITVIPPATFNSAFQPTAGPVFYDTFNNAGSRTFNPDGTGSVNILMGVSTSVPVPPGSSFTSTSSGAASWTVTSSFNYAVKNGIITMTLTPGSYLQTFLTGSRAGQTATIDVQSAFAYISADGKNLLTVTRGTEVETHTYSNGDVRPEVCNRSANGFKLP